MTADERLDEHAPRCPDCGSEPEQPDVHRAGCPRLGTVMQWGPPWLPLPEHWARQP